MQITQLEKMESVVSNNKSLSWDGWTVLESYPSDRARTSKYGAFINNKWHMVKRFPLSENGWEIPDKFVR